MAILEEEAILIDDDGENLIAKIYKNEQGELFALEPEDTDPANAFPVLHYGAVYIIKYYVDNCNTKACIGPEQTHRHLHIK